MNIAAWLDKVQPERATGIGVIASSDEYIKLQGMIHVFFLSIILLSWVLILTNGLKLLSISF